MGQNAPDQSDNKIFKSAISLKQNDEKAWIFACWHKFIKLKVEWKVLGKACL